MSLIEYKKHLSAFKTSKTWTDLVKHLSELERNLKSIYIGRAEKIKKLLKKILKYKNIGNVTLLNEKNNELTNLFLNEIGCDLSYLLNPLINPEVFFLKENESCNFLKENEYTEIIKRNTAIYDKLKSIHEQNKKIFKVPSFPIYPFRGTAPNVNILIKRLNQCMNEHLPSGVHLKVMNIYQLMLNSGNLNYKNINGDSIYDISIFFGMFNYGKIAKMSAKEKYLSLIFDFFCLLELFEHEFLERLSISLTTFNQMLLFEDIELVKNINILYPSNKYSYLTFILLGLIPLLPSTFDLNTEQMEKLINGKEIFGEPKLDFTKRQAFMKKANELEKMKFLVTQVFKENEEFYSCLCRVILNERVGRVEGLKILKDCVILEQKAKEKNYNHKINYFSPYTLPALMVCLNDGGFAQKGAFDIFNLIFSKNDTFQPEIIFNTKKNEYEVEIPYLKIELDLVFSFYRCLLSLLNTKDHSTLQRIMKSINTKILICLFIEDLEMREKKYVNNFSVNLFIKAISTFAFYRDDQNFEEPLEISCVCGSTDNLEAFFSNKDSSVCVFEDKKEFIEKSLESTFIRHSPLSINSFIPSLMMNTTLKKNFRNIKKITNKFSDDNKMANLISSLGEDFVGKEIFLLILNMIKKFNEGEKYIRKDFNALLLALYKNVKSDLFTPNTYLIMLILISQIYQMSSHFFDEALFTDFFIILCYQCKMQLNVCETIYAKTNFFLEILSYLKKEDTQNIDFLKEKISLENILFKIIFIDNNLNYKHKLKIINFLKFLKEKEGINLIKKYLKNNEQVAVNLINTLFAKKQYEGILILLGDVNDSKIIRLLHEKSFAYLDKLCSMKVYDNLREKYGKRYKACRKLIQFLLNIQTTPKNSFSFFLRKAFKKDTSKMNKKVFQKMLNILFIIFEENDRGQDLKINYNKSKESISAFIDSNMFLMKCDVFQFVPVFNDISNFILGSYNNIFISKFNVFISKLTNINILNRTVEYCYVAFISEDAKEIIYKTKFSNIFTMIDFLLRNPLFLRYAKKSQLFFLNYLIVERLVSFIVMNFSSSHKTEKRQIRNKLQMECLNNLMRKLIKIDVLKIKNLLKFCEKVIETYKDNKKIINLWEIFLKSNIFDFNPKNFIFIDEKVEINLSENLSDKIRNIQFESINSSTKLIEYLNISKIILKNADNEIYHKIYFLFMQSLISMFKNGKVEISGGIKKIYEYKYSHFNIYNNFRNKKTFKIEKPEKNLTVDEIMNEKEFTNRFAKIKDEEILEIEDNSLSMNFPLSKKIKMHDSFSFIRENRSSFIQIYELCISLYDIIMQDGREIDSVFFSSLKQERKITSKLSFFFPTDENFLKLINSCEVDNFPTCFLIKNFPSLEKLIQEKKAKNLTNALRFIYRILIKEKKKLREKYANPNFFNSLIQKREIKENLKEVSLVECVCCDALLLNLNKSETFFLKKKRFGTFSINLLNYRISIYEKAINKLAAFSDIINTSKNEKNEFIEYFYPSNLRILSYFYDKLKTKNILRFTLLSKKDDDFTIFDEYKNLTGCEKNWYMKTISEAFIVKEGGGALTNLNTKFYLNICENTNTCEKDCSFYYGAQRHEKIRKNKEINLEVMIGHDFLLANKKPRNENIVISHISNNRNYSIQKLYSLSLLVNEKIETAPFFSFYFNLQNGIQVKSKVLKKIALILMANKVDQYSGELKNLIKIISEGFKPIISEISNLSYDYQIPNNPNLLASVLVLIRAMICRFSLDMITNIWPIFYEIILDILENLVKNSESLKNYKETGFLIVNKNLDENFIFKKVDFQVVSELMKTLDVVMLKSLENDQKMLVSGQLNNFYLEKTENNKIPFIDTSSLLKILRIGLFNKKRIKNVIPMKRTLLIRNMKNLKDMSYYLQVSEDFYRKIELMGVGEDNFVYSEMRGSEKIFEKEEEEITRVICQGIEYYTEDNP